MPHVKTKVSLVVLCLCLIDGDCFAMMRFARLAIGESGEFFSALRMTKASVTEGRQAKRFSSTVQQKSDVNPQESFKIKRLKIDDDWAEIERVTGEFCHKTLTKKNEELGHRALQMHALTRSFSSYGPVLLERNRGFLEEFRSSSYYWSEKIKNFGNLTGDDEVALHNIEIIRKKGERDFNLK